jgi:uncharacterized protein YneF (UPF0154 family)
MTWYWYTISIAVLVVLIGGVLLGSFFTLREGEKKTPTY